VFHPTLRIKETAVLYSITVFTVYESSRRVAVVSMLDAIVCAKDKTDVKVWDMEEKGRESCHFTREMETLVTFASGYLDI
jgi:hypothetical protein